MILNAKESFLITTRKNIAR